MPATEQNLAALIVFDIRSFQLTKEQGKILEEALRQHLFVELEKMDVDMTKKSAINLEHAVFGISID